MNDWAGTLLLFMALFAFGALIGWLMDRRARGILTRWAAEEGLTLQEASFRLFRRGPFWFSGRGHVVYRIAAVARDGAERTGWARCGSWLFGVMSEQAEVRWDDET